MNQGRARGAIIAILLVYLSLALPLPSVLLDHELGLLMGDPAHTVLDNHAWLDHAAGSGLSETGQILDGGDLSVVLDRQVPVNVPTSLCVRFHSSRGPPLN